MLRFNTTNWNTGGYWNGPGAHVNWVGPVCGGAMRGRGSRPVIIGRGRGMVPYANVGARTNYRGGNVVGQHQGVGNCVGLGYSVGQANITHGSGSRSGIVNRGWTSWKNPNDLQTVVCWNCGGQGHIAACCGSPGGVLAQHALKRRHIEGPVGQTQVNVASIEEVTEEVGQNKGGVGDNGGTTFVGGYVGGTGYEGGTGYVGEGNNFVGEDEFFKLQDENANFIEVKDLDNVNASGASWVWALSVDPSKSEDNNLYDSGASKHISPFKEQFQMYQKISCYPIKVASNHTLNAIGISSIYINITNSNKNTKLLLTNVLHVPGICMTVVSMSCMLAAGYESHFQDEQCIITTRGRQLTLGSIPVGEGGLFKSKHAYAFTMQS